MTDARETTTQATPPAPPRARSYGRWLIASVAINLLLLGIIGGGLVAMKNHRGPFGGMMRAAPEDFGLISFARTLPDERREIIKKDLRAARPRLKPFFEASADARVKAAAVLAADPFDRSALETALQAVQAEDMKLRGEGLKIFLEEAEKLTLEERQQLAELWKKRRRHRGQKADDEDKKP